MAELVFPVLGTATVEVEFYGSLIVRMWRSENSKESPQQYAN